MILDTASHSREAQSSIAALVLAAGRGLRFDAADNKLLADVGGRPLICRAVEAALASRARPTIVVTGHERLSVEAALADYPVVFTHNADYASGLASSLRAGLAQAASRAGVLVLLGDMPGVTPAILNRLIAAFENAPAGILAAAPFHRGRRGNPVLLGHGLFPQLEKLEGDIGARKLLQSVHEVLDVPIEDEGVATDVDTRLDMERLRTRLRGTDER